MARFPKYLGHPCPNCALSMTERRESRKRYDCFGIALAEGQTSKSQSRDGKAWMAELTMKNGRKWESLFSKSFQKIILQKFYSKVSRQMWQY